MESKDWDVLAAANPLRTILWRNEPWDLAEFMATGVANVRDMLKFIGQTWTMPEDARALDFGCGIGRLAVPLSEHCKEVVAADISPIMVLKAIAINGRPNIQYVVHQEAHLKRWPSNSFDFILCYLTLQHLIEEQAIEFMREFMRLRSDRGIIVLQMPSANGGGVTEQQSGEMLMTRMDPVRVLTVFAKPNLVIRAKFLEDDNYLYVMQGRRTYKK